MHDLAFRGKQLSFAMHLSGKMTVNKNYIYIIRFDRGTAEVTDKRPDPKGTLWHVVFKATCIPEHRIAIEAHEDPADPCEVGAAMRRLEALRQHLVAKSIDAQRLEMQVHGKNCCKETNGIPGEFWRRAEIRLFPRVESLCTDVGDRFLSYREVYIFESAVLALITHDKVTCKELENQCTRDEWKRILGYESLREWIEAGGYHPLYLSA